MATDRLGRRRQPGQTRGLRPLHPRLPGGWVSKALRVSMSQDDWDRFEALVDRLSGPVDSGSTARARGDVLARLLDHDAQARDRRRDPVPAHWMDWERQKTLRLLRSAV